MNTLQKISVATAGAAFMALGTIGAAPAVTVVSPNNVANVEGDAANSYPFNIGNPNVGSLTSQRYQQVYAATDFGALSQPQLITRISFRPDATLGSAFASTLPDIQINFSTTTKAPDQLSSTFSNNVGADDTVVYNRGSLTLASAFTGAAGGPKAFDINIDLTTPFLYNPTAGNLLLDVRNFGGGTTTFFDAQSTIGDPVSRSYSVAAGVNSTTANGVDSVGLVTQFTLTPTAVPFEFSPGMGLLAVGAWGAFSHLKSQQQKRKFLGSEFSSKQ
ncbi:MAG TPA: hypothetical protein V6D12_24445 [Candidatus Obscuribacterales bacterium]